MCLAVKMPEGGRWQPRVGPLFSECDGNRVGDRSHAQSPATFFDFGPRQQPAESRTAEPRLRLSRRYSTRLHMALRHDKGRRLRGGALPPPPTLLILLWKPAIHGPTPPPGSRGWPVGGGWTARGCCGPIKAAARQTVAIIRWPNSLVS